MIMIMSPGFFATSVCLLCLSVIGKSPRLALHRYFYSTMSRQAGSNALSSLTFWRSSRCRHSLRTLMVHRQASTSSKPSLNVPTTSGGPQDPLAYCSSLVQRLDPESWLCSYFWPRREKAWYLAWRAFNASSASCARSKRRGKS